MPEIKNAFIHGKMNKDLDERLVPNGEYRDALNIDVDYSDGSDIGALKNINRPTKGYFDSGIKFNLVPDYFEVFFPLYSSNGFEPIQSRYATKIRFIFSPRLKTLSSLFSRKWF